MSLVDITTRFCREPRLKTVSLPRASLVYVSTYAMSRPSGDQAGVDEYGVAIGWVISISSLVPSAAATMMLMTPRVG